MNLCIDVGNSRVKLGVFKQDNLIDIEIVSIKKLLEKVKKLNQNYNFKAVILSSVALIDKNMLKKMSDLVNLVVLNKNLKFPFTVNYCTPETLGVDRLALMAAASKLYPHTNVLVIDAGTCITYDFLSDSKIYCGGAISPGLNMRYKALHQQTDNLPNLSIDYPKKLIGNSTEQSIHSGICIGVICEINGVIAKYQANYRKLTVVLTGGDTNFLAEKLKSGIFANPNFLFTGLNYILNFNL